MTADTNGIAKSQALATYPGESVGERAEGISASVALAPGAVAWPEVLHALDRKGRTIDVAPARSLVERILREWNPERIHLFGSRARGESSPDSDWDFLVVVPDASSIAADPLVPWRLRRDTGVRADIVVYSSSDFGAERLVPNTVAHEAVSAGVALYRR